MPTVHPSLSARAQSASSAAALSPRLRQKLEKFSTAKPLLSPVNRKFPLVADDPERQALMPANRTLCFGGSMLKEAASKEVLAAKTGLSNAGDIAADALLMAKRQEKETQAMIALKFVLALWVMIPFPVEGLRHARQTRRLMEKILREEGANLERLKRLDLSKMTLHQGAECTPIRHGKNLQSSVLPCNTPATRLHLESVLSRREDRDRLREILASDDNYVRDTIDPGRGSSLEGATLSEKGWRKIVAIIIEKERSEESGQASIPRHSEGGAGR